MRSEANTGLLKDFIRRSLDGPVMRELDFDLKLGRQLKLLTSEHSIRFSPEEIICDDAVADSIWQAALQLLERVGIYNTDTNRVVLLRAEEAEKAVAGAPKEITVGEGNDAVTIRARSHDSPVPPVILALPARTFRYRGGRQSLFARMMESYVSDAGPLGELARRLKDELEGIPYLAETPGEMIWARAVVRWQKAIVGLMGKPGLWLSGTQVTSPPAILALFTEEGLLNKFNSHISVSLMPELKLNWDRLRMAHAAQAMGVHTSCSADPILGAYCRTGEEAAIVAAATLLGYIAFAGASAIPNTNVVDRQGDRTTRVPLQASAAARRALERNAGMLIHGSPDTKSGLGTGVDLYELAALAVACTCSGAAWTGRGYACGLGPNGEYRPDLDCELVTMVSRGTAGLSRERANELLLKLLHICESHDAAAEGKPLDYYYDIKTLTPSRELVAIYDRVAQELQRLGIPMG
ncbi:MAG: monomethylamine:corrinoid methyltransferase [Chloroflexi bacterium]|nr:monomethylamine:corrinoid methyltransferase [Chloroflexota bacterium]